MTKDGIALVEYLIVRFAKQKIILFGTSWGSELGAMMAIQRPDLFYAYVGHSQVVNPSRDLVAAYDRVLKMAATDNDAESVVLLNTIGKPPYAAAKSAGQLLRVIKKYERINSLPAPISWFQLDRRYDNAEDNQHRADGDDYSFLHYVGDSLLGIRPMTTGFNLLRDGLRFKIPVYFIQGEEDILTAKDITMQYFRQIKAPRKEFISVPKAAHGFNESIVNTQYRIMMQLAVQ